MFLISDSPDPVSSMTGVRYYFTLILWGGVGGGEVFLVSRLRSNLSQDLLKPVKVGMYDPFLELSQ